jgi:hypothetical protein
LKAQAAFAVAEQEKNALRAQLREQLNMFLETRESARGLIMMVPDVLIRDRRVHVSPASLASGSPASQAFSPRNRISMSRSRGTPITSGDDERISDSRNARAQEVFAYLVQQKIPSDSMNVSAFGETRPIASNDTAEGRQQNRRVELVVSGESIGVSGSQDSPQ